MINAIAALKCQRVSKSCVTRRNVWCVLPSNCFSLAEFGAIVLAPAVLLLLFTARTASACRSTDRYTRFRNRHDPSILSSLHSRSFSGGAANNVYSLPVSAPYLSAISSAPTTLPFDLDMATPPFCTMPCVNNRAIGSLWLTNPMSRITLHQNREYSRCKIACVIPPIYWSIVNQYATLLLSNGASSLCGSQYR